MEREPLFTLIWLTGLSCDGCTIKALGDSHNGGLESLLCGENPGLPRVRLVHPILNLESGDEFVAILRQAERGELEPFGIINESAVSQAAYDPAFVSSLGEENGRPVPFGKWLARLAPRAEFVIAWGDCAVWGGPHSLGPNPASATGTAMLLGTDYRSALDLPVINLPGCAPPAVLLDTLLVLLSWRQGSGPALQLDETHRPRFAYSDVWTGAFSAWWG